MYETASGKNQEDLEVLRKASNDIGNPRLPLKPFTAEETREIIFKTMLDAEVHLTITLDDAEERV